ncbi:MAG: hypothetical protein ACXVFT_24125 [Solirubrobacteraceae bacterium]
MAREFSAVLKAAAREANTTTEVLREPWNGHDLETAAKNTPARATRPRVSLLAQVTAADLRRHLTNTDVLDGFVNRFLLAGLRRSKSLPASRSLANEALTDVATRVGLALKHAKVAGRLTRDKKAAELWASVYDELNTRPPSLLGNATARGPAQVVRLSLVYALLDAADAIRVEHLRAALAVGATARPAPATASGASGAPGPTVCSRTCGPPRASR